MNRKQLADRIGNIDDRLVQQAEDVPNYARLRREKRLKRLAGMAAVLVLMACSGAVGALAFSRETVTEVPAEQEQVVLREIGVTLLLPDSWKGRYEVVEDTFAPYGSAMWEFCVRSVYEAKTPIEGAGGSFYRGTLFTVLQCADYSMSAEEFAQGGLAGIGQYLFATQDATYAVLYAGDIQFDPTDAEQQQEWYSMAQTAKDIRFVLSDMLSCAARTVAHGAGRGLCAPPRCFLSVGYFAPRRGDASGGPISFGGERNGGENAAKSPRRLDFLSPHEPQKNHKKSKLSLQNENSRAIIFR